MASADLLLPVGTRMLHIGPHKTGTTAMQSAMFAKQRELLRHGVLYAGTVRHSMPAVFAVTNRPQMIGQATPTMQDWEVLVDEITASTAARSVISSEFFADASDKAIARIARDLGPRTHVVVTLRPLAHLLASQWQQYVQNGLRAGYSEWLDGMFRRPPYTKPNPTFWRRHRHDALIERWAAVVGPENVTAIVLDRSDRSFVFDAFESLLGLPSGLLEPVEGLDNRSLTQGEVELIRQFNVAFFTNKWPAPAYHQFIRLGAVNEFKTRVPGPDEPRVVTPQWALDRASEIGSEIAARIPTLGVRVVGDLDDLSATPDAVGEPPAPGDTLIPAEVAALAVLGAVQASGQVDTSRLERRAISEVTTAQLGLALGRRVQRKARSIVPHPRMG